MNRGLFLSCLAHLVLAFAQRVPESRNSIVVFPTEDNLPSVEEDKGRPQSPSVVDRQTELCITPEGLQGRCVVYDTCPLFMTRRINFEALRSYSCGFAGQVPRVCCPQAESRSADQEERASFTSDRPSQLPTDCGHSTASHNRIVNGEEAEPGAWPWLAALFIETRGIRSAECGGALISAQYVITAAHCVSGNSGSLLSPRRLIVRLGDHHLFTTNDTTAAVDISVESITRHPQFNHRNFLNDIALLKLSENASLSSLVHPVCLPYDSPIRTDDLEGKKAFVAGWGTTSFDGPSSPVIRQVQLPIWNQTDCRHAYRNDVNLTDEYMCAGLADGGKDACQGDSGGPMMLPVNPEGLFHLIGIVSFGKQCAQPDFPGVYTNVRLFLPWIAENLQ